MRKYFKKIIYLIPFISLFVLSKISFAEETKKSDIIGSYIPLEPGFFTIGNNGGKVDVSNLSTLLNQIFVFGIAVAAALAVGMIAWGGIQYMTTDSWMGKEDGRKKIEDALYGLGLALISWLILYIINPDLVKFSGNTFLGN